MSLAAPAYLDTLLRWRARLRELGHTGPVFMHLGYFDDVTADASDVPVMLRAQRRLTDRLLDLADVQPGDRVLDVGCGLGGVLCVLAQRDASLGLVGLGPSAQELAAARVELSVAGAHGGRLVRADACALPFGAGCFERVLAVESALHFSSRAVFVAEAARVLVPGGRLALSDFVPVGPAPEVETLRALVEGNAPWPDPWCEHGGVVALAAKAGLSLREREDATAAVLPTFSALLARAPDGLSPVDLATATLGRLLEARRLRMEFLAFERAG